jgi:hypothetical protein
MGTHIEWRSIVMKTTIDIADDLISRAKVIQKRDDVTLRSLIEEGLRLALDRHSQKTSYKFAPVVVGEPYKLGMPILDVNALIAESNERPDWRVNAPATLYGEPKKRSPKK